MSAKLQAHAPFISLLLNTEFNQQKALLQTLSGGQRDVVLEILFNLYQIRHNVEDLPFFRKKKSFLRHFDRTRSTAYRKRYLTKHVVPVIKVFRHFKDKLLELL